MAYPVSTMLVGEVKALARKWVMEEGRLTPGFIGAYIAGSANYLPDDAPQPATSDLDTMVVLEDPGNALKPGKFVYQGALLEASYIGKETLSPPEAVLSSGAIAGGFRGNSVILDPTGMLTELSGVVAREFARRHWVRKRCERAAEQGLGWARAYDESIPLHDQVQATAFSAGVTVFPLLAAALKNLTVRKRYAAAREVLEEYGRLDFHEDALALFGCAQMSRERVEQHLRGVTEVFDAAKEVRRTPYRFGSDISEAARPISIDGSWELIERGLHREAVFWLVATHGRCRHILAADAPELLPRFDPVYLDLLADLGMDSVERRRQRCRQIEAFVPEVWEVTEAILAANPEIQD